MVSRYAVVANGVVTNIVAAEADFAAQKGLVAATAGVAIGWTYDGNAFAAPVIPIQATKTKILGKAKALRDRKINEGVAVPGIGTFDSDLESRINILGAVTAAMLAAQAGKPFTIDWKLADNSLATLDGAQMIEVGVAVFQHIAAIHAAAQAVGTAILAAADSAALEAIDVGAAMAVTP